MLPSRAIVRSVPSLGLRGQAPGGRGANPPTPALLRRLGRNLSSVRRGSSPVLLARSAAGTTVTLGSGAASARQLSLWGYGKKKTAGDGEAAPAPDAAARSPAQDPLAEHAAPAPPPPLEPPASTPAPEPDVSPVPDAMADGAAADVASMPEGIGYLKALGLEYGWGPTSAMQWCLEHLHVHTGLGWGASIMLTAVLLRCAMLYPQVRSLRFNGVMQTMRKDPRAQEAMKMVQQGLMKGDMAMRQRGQFVNKKLKAEYGVSNLGMLWSFGQIPFTFGLFRIVSSMANVPVPALESAGYLWFTDLTATDPYFILPAAGTALMVAALSVNSKYTPEAQKKMLQKLTYVFGFVGFIGTSFLSAGVNLMTVALGASTLVTSIVLNNPTVRSKVGLSPHPRVETPSSSAAAAAATATQASYEAPRQPLRDRLNNHLDEVRKGFSEHLANYTGAQGATQQEKAEQKRRELIRKLEDTRKQQEREEFERKYKGKS
ncbi:uncharacterized protein UV8b_06966 [Ustilaginoidea virens]|uniref:Membrane insertase YidC/Oxa/ALB C-terminal domain-containing protein n=1 Tax=Ustilaginoidea virens TaxID=1159556 RepID=A0A8E5HWK6_USTVR|nr:uncharacterized protein UV8b_06966 [Ustilaginoidea virens]QUC22725.1 hypothetical protein UV8b_06966 [Ustilaginoidea virens]